MKSLNKVINGKELTFNTKGCTSSAAFFFKVNDMILSAYNTSEQECDNDNEIFMNVIRSRNEVLNYFLNM